MMFSKRLILLGCYLTLSLVSGKTFQEDLTLNEEEKQSLDKFKDLVFSQVTLPHDYMKTDFYLIRWLRARNYNSLEAKKMLVENLKWRKEKKMDSIHSEDWSYYSTYFPFSNKGLDHEGKPIFYLNIGTMDFRKEVIAGRLERLLHWVNKGLDELSNTVRDLGEKHHNVSQGVLIINMKGFNLVQHACVPAILSIMVTYESYYPGLLDKIFILNMPAAAQPLLQASRGFLHPETNRILKAYGTNRNIWQKELIQSIDLKELAPELGGQKAYKDDDDDFDFD